MRAAAAGIALVLTGCASLGPGAGNHPGYADPALAQCAAAYRQHDERVVAADARDAQDSPVAGFPYLRVNRLLASYRDAAARDEALLRALVERMQALDASARALESANVVGGAPLPPPGCGASLRNADLARPAARAALLEAMVVPDDYSDGLRTLGFYFLSKGPFSEGVRKHLAEVRAAYARPLAVAAGATLERHVPPAGRMPPRVSVAAMLAQAAANPLGIAELRDSELEVLYRMHAPIYEIENSGPHDRFGALRAAARGEAPSVDPSAPVVYRHAAWTRYRGRTLLQLVYTLWFPERPAQSAADILAGRLDGVTWRVTLAPDGEPVLYDTIHPCGCFHMFYPTPRASPVAAPGGEVEWMFSPQALPRVPEGARVLLRIAAGTHYVERVALVSGVSGAPAYELRPYDELRSMERIGGGRSSAFGPDGLVAGTERPERMLFWPMGIVSAGAMRQWGRQATAFVGRRHFDDADLLEKRFELQLQ